MLASFAKYRSIPPNKLILFKLKKDGLKQADLAQSVGCSLQELNAILRGKRGIPLALSLKIEKCLDFEEGLLSAIQLYQQIDKLKSGQSAGQFSAPPQIREILFWDTDFDKIDWYKHREFVIKRVRQYGNPQENDVIDRYYGRV